MKIEDLTNGYSRVTTVNVEDHASAVSLFPSLGKYMFLEYYKDKKVKEMRFVVKEGKFLSIVLELEEGQG